MKRIVLAAFSAFSLPQPAVACPPGWADVNASGSVQVADVNCVLLAVLAQAVGAEAPGCLVGGADVADLDCSAAVDVSDVVLAIQVALGAALPLALDGDQDDCPDACMDLLEPPGNPLEALSDAFDDPASLTSWTERAEVEGDAVLHDQLDIGSTTPGWLTMDPNAYQDPRFPDGGSGPAWFQDRHGVLLYREVTGDFAVRVALRVGTRANMAAFPTGNFNSAGLLVRDPASYDSDAPDALGNESWVMYNLGRQAGFAATETKTTFADGPDAGLTSDSTLFLHPAEALAGELIACRQGAVFSFYRRLEGSDAWEAEDVDALGPWLNGGLVGPNWSDGFVRDDLPETVQVGLIANRWELGWGSAVRAQFDEVQFWSPAGPTGCFPPAP